MIGSVSPSHIGLIQSVVKNGSPGLLNMAGRAIGLGEDEQSALAQGKLPFWFWIALGVTGGVVIGIQVHKRWPTKVPKIVGG